MWRKPKENAHKKNLIFFKQSTQVLHNFTRVRFSLYENFSHFIVSHAFKTLETQTYAGEKYLNFGRNRTSKKKDFDKSQPFKCMHAPFIRQSKYIYIIKLNSIGMFSVFWADTKLAFALAKRLDAWLLSSMDSRYGYTWHLNAYAYIHKDNGVSVVSTQIMPLKCSNKLRNLIRFFSRNSTCDFDCSAHFTLSFVECSKFSTQHERMIEVREQPEL